VVPLDGAASAQHLPVLFDEVLAGLCVRPGGVYVDATVGGGGHAAGILDVSAPGGRLLCLDADPEAVAFAARSLARYGDRVVLRSANFRQLWSTATDCGFVGVDGVLMDLGLSSRQLADAKRGFSFGLDGPLDMRLDPSRGTTAADLVNSLPEKELADLLYRFGDERFSRRIARAIVAARPLKTTRQLATLVTQVVGRREKIDPSTRTFQALRIAVNGDLDALIDALPQAVDLLRPRGRLAVISFQSQEDVLVKQFTRREARDCLCPSEMPVCTCGHRASLRIVTPKPIRPSEAEISRNPRSRSAKLRVAESLSQGLNGSS